MTVASTLAALSEDILNAEEGFELIRISDNENVGSSVWLRNGDTQDNYKEIEHAE